MTTRQLPFIFKAPFLFVQILWEYRRNRFFRAVQIAYAYVRMGWRLRGYSGYYRPGRATIRFTSVEGGSWRKQPFKAHSVRLPDGHEWDERHGLRRGPGLPVIEITTHDLERFEHIAVGYTVAGKLVMRRYVNGREAHNDAYKFFHEMGVTRLYIGPVVRRIMAPTETEKSEWEVKR